MVIILCLTNKIQAQNLSQQESITIDTLLTDVYNISDVTMHAKPPANWYKFLGKNIKTSIAIANGAPPNTYKVFIQFMIDKDGSLSNIKALSNWGYGMEEEAIRVLKIAPSWFPAQVNNQPVRVYITQPIFFVTE